MEKLQEEDVAELLQKKEAQLKLKAEVDAINRQAQAQKIIRAEQEKIQDLKVFTVFDFYKLKHFYKLNCHWVFEIPSAFLIVDTSCFNS